MRPMDSQRLLIFYVLEVILIWPQFVECQAFSCSAATTTVTSVPDATSLAAACPTFEGNIEIANIASDGAQGTLELDGLELVQGDLGFYNISNLFTLAGPSLRAVNGVLRLQNVSVTEFIFGNLAFVGNLELRDLPSFPSDFSLTHTLREVDNIHVSGSSPSLDLPLPNVESVNSVNISDNDSLDNITLGVANIKGSLIIESNWNANTRPEVNLPNLQSAGEVSISDVQAISWPKLANVSGDLSLSNNDITECRALQLYNVDGTLNLTSNSELSDLALPKLATLGGLQLRDNNALSSIDTFEELKEVVGRFYASGPIKQLDLPDVEEIGGAFLISSSRGLDCSQYDRFEEESVVRGSYECHANQPDDAVAGNDTATDTSDTPGSSGTTGTANGPSDGDHNQGGLSTGAKAGIGVGCAAGFLVLVGAVFLYSRRKRTSARRNEILQPGKLHEKDRDAYGRVAMLGDDGQYYEMGQPPSEMPAETEPRELSASHGMTEMDGSTKRFLGDFK